MAAPARVPYEEGYFTVPADPAEPPRLLGTRCRACGEHFYPRRVTCARCLSDDVEGVPLGPHGTLYTHTFLHAVGFGEHKSTRQGYAAGQVDLAEGPRVQSVLVGQPGDFRIGMAMAMVLEVVGQDRDGNDVVMYRFRPVP
jgi:uncharacterized OB-fold protein